MNVPLFALLERYGIKPSVKTTPTAQFPVPKTLNSTLQNRKLTVKSENNQPTNIAVQASTGPTRWREE